MYKRIFFWVLLCILIGGILYYIKSNPGTPSNTNEVIEKKIDILEGKIDSLSLQRDSIRSIIDTSRVKIVEIHEEYNKVRTNIIYQPVDSDYVQFTKYCADNEGLLDINNTSATEDN